VTIILRHRKKMLKRQLF